MYKPKSTSHSAEGAALGFYYQSLYALFAILQQPHDDAAVCLERLDDVELVICGEALLIQLKHSISDDPAPITLASRALWRTLKAWIDILPKVVLDVTRFQLVSVALLQADSVLRVLLSPTDDRKVLHEELLQEARRVRDAHKAALDVGEKPPYIDRIAGCVAFIELEEVVRLTLLSRISITPGSTNISNIRDDIAGTFVLVAPSIRVALVSRLIEWWDLQVVFTLCGNRERLMAKLEVQEKIAELVGEIERDELMADFESALLPDDHIPNSMLVQQISLVGGTLSDVRVAVRDEWRARSQRHKWIVDRLGMATRIALYDGILKERWQDKHERIKDDCKISDDAHKSKVGHQLLRWSYDSAHTEVRPFAPNWNAGYYVHGSFHVLSIDLTVGWHPEFIKLLGPST